MKTPPVFTEILIKNALKDPTNKYFVLVSESCIPLYDFEYIYNVISLVKSSWLFTDITPQLKPPEGYIDMREEAIKQIKDKEKLNITKENIMRNSQWMILNRKHAEIIDEFNHEDQFTHFHVADEWYHYNVLQKYDTKIEENIISNIKSTFFYYHNYEEVEIKKNLDYYKTLEKNNGASHPQEFPLKYIKHVKENTQSLFLRKVSADLRITYKDIIGGYK